MTVAVMAGRAKPFRGNDMDNYADDLAAVIEALDLKDATLVGHSTGGGEVSATLDAMEASELPKLFSLAPCRI